MRCSTGITDWSWEPVLIQFASSSPKRRFSSSRAEANRLPYTGIAFPEGRDGVAFPDLGARPIHIPTPSAIGRRRIRKGARRS